jgi:hypothetical protein
MPPVALESIESATVPVKACEAAVPVSAVQASPYTDTWLPGAAVLGWRSTELDVELDTGMPAAVVVFEPCEGAVLVAAVVETAVELLLTTDFGLVPDEAVLLELPQAPVSRASPATVTMARAEREVMRMCRDSQDVVHSASVIPVAAGSCGLHAQRRPRCHSG